jgi:YcaO-like protein with predicted kinase domain
VVTEACDVTNSYIAKWPLIQEVTAHEAARKAESSRLEAILDRVPVTRVADITRLDVLGVPVFAAITPLAKDLTTHLGKGLDKESARVSAVMEAVERVSAEQIAGSVRRATYEELRSSGNNVADPVTFDLPPRTTFRKDSQFEWVEGWELFEGRPIWVLADLARSPASEGVLDQVDTNGLAAGFTYGEAVRRAVLEVIERDAVSQHHFFELYGGDGSIEPPKRRIDPNSLLGTPRVLVERAWEANLDVVLEDLTADLEVSVISSTLIDYAFASVQGPSLYLFGGWGADLNPEIAVTRAITEAFQSRLGVIQGARDSFNQVPRAMRPFTTEKRRSVLQPVFGYKFSAAEETKFGHIEAEIDFLLERFKSVGFRKAIIIDMRRKDLDLPVVRFRVPGLSAFTVDRRRLGWRCARHLL